MATVVSAPATIELRLPGRAQPRQEALREYTKLNDERRRRISPVFWPFWAPDPEKFYRWRIRLDCQCIKEVLTYGEDDPPDKGQWLDPVNEARLPAGQLFCRHDNAPPTPYQRVMEWGKRRELSFPADPVDPPDWLDAQTWAVIRRDEPHSAAFWTVILTCGHVTEVCTNLDWKPEDGPQLVTSARLQEMIAECEEHWATEPEGHDDNEREHTRRMLAEGWPTPFPERQCSTCRCARTITAYQRIGWLVPPTPAPTPPAPNRAVLERRLSKIQAEADRLREQLAHLESDDQD